MPAKSHAAVDEPIQYDDNRNLTHPVAAKLSIAVYLRVNGNGYQIPGANVTHLSLQAHDHGFTGNLDFWLRDERNDASWHTDFTDAALMTCELHIAEVYEAKTTQPLILFACILDKSLTEPDTSGVSGNSVLFSHYKLRFCDTAQALWRQHFPTRLYTDTAISDIFNEHCVDVPDRPGQSIIQLDFDGADTKLPLICLPLGNDYHHCPSQNGSANCASFYDFVLDYAQSNGLHFNYLYDSHHYAMAEQKPSLTSASPLYPSTLRNITCHWPAAQWASRSLLNGIADNPKTRDLNNVDAVTGLYRETLFRCNLKNDFDRNVVIAQRKIRQVSQQLSLELASWPKQCPMPNGPISIDVASEGNQRSYSGKQFRVCRTTLILTSHSAEATLDSGAISAASCSENTNLNAQNFNVSYHIDAEQATCQRLAQLAYNPVVFPIMVEATVVSNMGTENDKTYDLTTNDTTQQLEYSLYVPLWNKTIKVLFEPDFMNGHFYFPLYRDTKLLLKIDFDRAHIAKILSWGVDVQLARTTQGNHLLFGKNDTDETSIQHTYEADKPVLNILRRKSNDTEMVRLQEGSIIFQTQEE
jgi:hypothetical protein